MRKKTLIVTVFVASFLVLVGLCFWYSMGAPLYTPGMVRAGKGLRAPLDPPKQTGDPDYWMVEHDIRLSFTTQGTGPPILVVHGGPGYPLHSPVTGLEPLQLDHTILCYDERGCGKSTRPFDRFSSGNFYTNMMELDRTLGIGAQVADIERIRRILGKDKLILLGHSFGAFLAAMYAAEFPERVEALVLAAPAGVLVLPDESDGVFELIRRTLPGERQADYDNFLKEYLDFGSIFSKSESELAKLNRRLGEFFLTAAGQSAEPGSDSLPEDNGGWMVQAMYFSMGKRHDYRPALSRIKAPTLIIHGEGDIVPLRISQTYADGIPNAQLQVLGDRHTKGGHFPFTEQPEAFASTVRSFLAGNE